jgi:predicted peptidase
MKPHILLALILCATVPAVAAHSPEAGQHPQSFEKQVTIKLDYLMYLPADYGKDESRKWPLIVFLHGSGESGSDVQKVTKHGPPELLAKGTDLALKDLVVVSPQCPSSRIGWQPYMLNPFLDEILAKYKVDPDQVYLTGLSMGGYGTWLWAEQNPGRFAAIAPMSGGGNANPRVIARALRRMPIWNFHGEKDPTVPISESEAMIDAVKKAGNEDVKFTRYPDLGHDCWSQAYGTAELYDWFLQHKRQPMPQGRGR